MAIAVGTGTQTTSSASATSLTITKPTGTVSGDLLVATIVHQQATETVTAPAGWVSVVAANNVTTNNDLQVDLFYLIAGGSEPANYAFSWATAKPAFGGIIRVTGWDGTTASDVAASANSGSDTNAVALSVTTVTDGALVIIANAAVSGGATFTPPSGFTEEFDSGANQAAELSWMVQGTHGAVGDQTSVINALKQWVTTMWAVRPATSSTLKPPSLRVLQAVNRSYTY